MQTPGLNHIILTVSNTERSRAFYGDLLGFPITVIEEDPDKSFFSSQVEEFNSFSFRLASLLRMIVSVDFGSVWIIYPSARRVKEALQELADKLTAAGVDTKGVEQFIHTGNWYVSFRDPDNIQLEYWLP